MIMLTRVGNRRLSKGAVVGILLLIACDSWYYAYQRIQAVKAEIRMRTQMRDSLGELIRAADDVASRRPQPAR